MQPGLAGGGPPARAPAGKKSLSTLLIVLLVVAVVGVMLLGVLSALAIYGVRKYVVNAKEAEGRAGVGALAKGVAACSAGSLPPSTPPVPATLGSIRGSKYQSAPAEWTAEAFRCAGFALGTPQYFQYQWRRDTKSSGTARALADLDGDGSAEISLEVPVLCAEGACRAGALPDGRR